MDDWKKGINFFLPSYAINQSFWISDFRLNFINDCKRDIDSGEKKTPNKT